jgi:ABC-type transport system substrate-binding protein
MSTDYYGFDTTKPPFDDVRVRQAFGEAVDWRRIATLTLDDPSRGRDLDGAAGDPPIDPTPTCCRGTIRRPRVPCSPRPVTGTAVAFPRITLVTGGSPYDEAVVTELERELGITVDQETMDFDAYFPRSIATRRRCGSCRGWPTIRVATTFSACSSARIR